jgi:hypothetical protein
VLLTLYLFDRSADDWHYVVPTEPGILAYIAAFEDEAADWEQNEGRIAAQVTADAMRLEINGFGEGIYSAAEHYFGPFDLRLMVRALANPDPENTGYGVIFRQLDRDNYYLFLVSTDGYYRVSRVTDGVPQTISNWHTSDAIAQGTEAWNHLRVIGDNDRFQFFANGRLLELCIPDDPDAESTPLASGECQGGTWQSVLIDREIPIGRLGVAAEVDPDARETGLVVEFDNLLVYGPQAIDLE